MSIFLLFLLCGTIWEVLVLVLSWDYGRVLLWHQWPWDFWLGDFWWQLLFPYGWQIYLNCLFGLDLILVCGIYQKLVISFTFSNFVEYMLCRCYLVILWISSVSVVLSAFSFLILLFLILSAFWFVWIKVCLIDFLKEPTFFLCFYFIDLSPQFNYFLISTSPAWDFLFLF